MLPLTITTIQTNLIWENKQANLQMLETKLNSIQPPTEIVVLPEMFSTGFSMQPKLFAETMDGETVNWMKRMAITKKIILTGSIIIKEDGNYFNRLVWMLPNGQYGFYDKRHLFAFAHENQHYTAGKKRLIASVKGWKINLQICYDLRFPVWARQAPSQSTEMASGADVALEYDLIIYVANWPQKRIDAWKTLLAARAIENQCYVIGVNRVGNDGNDIYHSGNSVVINPLGETLYQKADEEDINTITLEKNDLAAIRKQFPFWKDGDDFTLML